MKKICPVCGKEFDQGNRKYCSKECSKEGQLRNQLKLYEEKRKAKEEKAVKQNALQETARKATEAGMSYGFRRKEKKMSNKDIIEGAESIALQYFTIYTKMLQLTGNSKEAIKLTQSLFVAMIEGNKPRPELGRGGFTLYWDRR